jgi:hypothetical protein
MYDNLPAQSNLGLCRIVMPGLVPGIHVFTRSPIKDVDGRDKPGHDGDHVHSNPTRSERFWHQCI